MLFSDRDDALFLDIDGALLETAYSPELVCVPDHLIELLYQLTDVLDGAVALVSSRSVDDVDRLFRPYRFATVGVHGCERRGNDGTLRLPAVDSEVINLLHDECSRFVGDSADLLAEYKSCGVAIHYRMAPERARTIREYLQSLVQRAGHLFAVIEGDHVCEITPVAHSRRTAIFEMMTSPPFQGRCPIYIADGQARDAFVAVNDVGGITIEVGSDGPTAAMLRIADIASVHAVLAALLIGCHRRLRPPPLTSSYATRTALSCRSGAPGPAER